jgi:hypothetical protein
MRTWQDWVVVALIVGLGVFIIMLITGRLTWLGG